MLPTAAIDIYDGNGEPHSYTALIDSRSQIHVISKKCRRHLKLPKIPADVDINRLGTIEMYTNYDTKIKIRCQYKILELEIKYAIVNEIFSDNGFNDNKNKINIPENVVDAC